MMIDFKGCLLVLCIIALIGFIGGAIASIWLGPIAMLWGAIGAPIGTLALVWLLLLWNKLT